FDLFSTEEKTMSNLPQCSQIRSGVVVNCDGKINIIFDCLLNSFHPGQLARQRQVEDVRLPLGPQPHAVPLLYFDAEYLHACEGIWGKWIANRHPCSSSAMRSRITPCILSSSCGLQEWLRLSRLSVAFPAQRNSFFSESVSVSTRRVRSSSISELSKK